MRILGLEDEEIRQLAKDENITLGEARAWAEIAWNTVQDMLARL